MKLNQDGIDLVKRFEGCKLSAYPDPATGGAPISIGYGHTGPEVSMGLTWSQEQCDSTLAADLAHVAHRISLLIRPTLTDNEFSALVSFAYNVGVGNLASSTLLKLINQGNIEDAAEEFIKWNKAAGKVMSGLTSRRESERTLFLT